MAEFLEIEQSETVRREEAAERLRRLADMLARNNDLEFERGRHAIAGLEAVVFIGLTVRVEVNESGCDDKAGRINHSAAA